MTKPAPVPCAENVRSIRDADGYYKPCPHKAVTMAKMPGEVIWTPLCGTHANADRWANYVDMEWRDLP